MAEERRTTWGKAEKLKSRKRIDRVFREGKSFSMFPYKVVYLVAPAGAPAPAAPTGKDFAPLQAGFGASSRNFKKAVDRNRIKRLSREAYRLQKAPLLEQLTQKGLSMAVFFVFIGRELPDYPMVSTRIGVALQKLLKETA
ncbi:MAG TPA: ribonuclease P protein component [Puia sp.]|jgi:ribonuclease P protein component